MGCYTYIIEQQSTVSDAARGAFQVWVQDGKPKLIDGPATNIDANMTHTLPDWMARIEEHCISGCESDSNLEAFYNCTIEFHFRDMIPKHIFFDVDGAISGDEYEITVSNFSWMSCDEEPPVKATNTSSSVTTSLVYAGAFLVITSLFY